METFSIFALTMTFLLAVYYAIIIVLDLKKIAPSEKKADEEVFKTSTNHVPQALEEEQPVDVDEDSFLHSSSEISETGVTSIESSQELPASITVEDVEQMDVNEVYARISNAKKEMITCKADIEEEISSKDFLQNMIDGEAFINSFAENLGGVSI